jgi:ribonucleoside-diphosphate reductase alpha chain
MEGWRLGLKAIALYRDGSKASQPLNTVGDSLKGEPVKEERATSSSGEGKSLRRGERKRLNKKRKGWTHEAKVGGHKLYIRTGEYPEGTLGEIFIDMHKEGATLRSIMNCFAIAISLGLQYGVPLDEFVNMFTHQKFEPHGPADHPNIKSATSVIDFIFKLLALEYLGRTDFAHVKPEVETLPPPVADIPLQEGNGDVLVSELVPVGVDDQMSQLMGDAPFCSDCGHLTVRSGACYKCLNCGNSMGCS